MSCIFVCFLHDMMGRGPVVPYIEGPDSTPTYYDPAPKRVAIFGKQPYDGRHYTKYGPQIGSLTITRTPKYEAPSRILWKNLLRIRFQSGGMYLNMMSVITLAPTVHVSCLFVRLLARCIQ